METDKIPFEDFAKLDLRVGTITSVEDHPDADKLYVLKVDLGTEERQLVAGMKAFYSKEEMQGKKVIIVANLKPVKLRGVESNGMLLAAEDDEGNVVLLTLEKEIKNNSKIR